MKDSLLMLSTQDKTMQKKNLKWFYLSLNLIINVLYKYKFKFELFVEDMLNFLEEDSFSISRPISMDDNMIKKPSDIEALFDSVSYVKVNS